MALPPLASVGDLEALGVDVGDDALAARLLDSVSAAVREAAGAVIAPPVTSTVALAAPASQWLRLPSRPVTSVSSVKIDGQEVADFRHVDSRLWRRAGWQGCDGPALVEVTYTHGLPSAPADIVKLVCTLAAAGLHEVQDGLGANRGVSSRRLDDFQESYTRGEDEVVDKTAIPERTRRMLRRRFGGGAEVVHTL